MSESESMGMDVDVIILGTSLRESILAAALSKAGFTVAHLDHNGYYGADDASLSLDELRQWRSERQESNHTSTYLSSQHARFTFLSSSTSAAATSNSRQFSISLSPTIVPSVGPLVDALIASGASRYGGFKLLERVALYDKPGFVKTVPGAKEDVFKSTELSLLDKRRLMRFLMFSASDFESKQELLGKEGMPFLDFLRQTFSLNQATAEAVNYALAFCPTVADPTLPALQRIRRYLRSAGRYGASPFLIGHYGGAGEIAQGFCRLSAVHGGIYILGRQISTVSVPPPPSSSSPETDQAASSRRRTAVKLQDFPEELTCDLLISTHDYLDTELTSQARKIPGEGTDAIQNQPIARCIAVIDKPIFFRNDRPATSSPPLVSAEDAEEEPGTSQQGDDSGQVDTALLIFPPGSVERGSATTAVNVLVSGEQSLASPRGHWVLHLSMPFTESPTQSAEEILGPYLEATLSLTSPRATQEAEQSDGIAPETTTSAIQPRETVFYIQHPMAPPPEQLQPSPSSIYTPPPNSTILSELADSAATNAETMFWKVVEALKEIKRSRREEKVGSGLDEPEEKVIESFWPPISDTSVVDQDW